MASKQYLHIVGRLKGGRELVLRPCFVTPNAHNVTTEGVGPVYVELITPRTKHPKRIQLITRPYIVDGQSSGDLQVFGKVPFPSTVSTVRFVDGSGRLLKKLELGKQKPELQMEWRPPKSAKPSGRKVVRYAGKAPAQQSLQFQAEYSNDGGKTWRSITRRTDLSQMTIDFSRLPGGASCRLAIMATDGINTTRVESEPFEVAMKRCQATIIRPKAGQKVAYGRPLLLHGVAFDPQSWQREEKELVWRSSRDGKLGTGTVTEVERLSRGEHTITLTAGAKGRRGKASVKVLVA